jgi:hypothetical protein
VDHDDDAFGRKRPGDPGTDTRIAARYECALAA